MRLQESGEMYIESIYVLNKRMGNVRSIDVCEHLGYSKPSVSRAMSLLKKGGFVEADKNGYLTLTDAGREIAEKMYQRHTVLSEFLISLGVSEETAVDDACKIEHHISDESFNAIKKYLQK
ncbi:MAG: metal-dependent transcriptional regulator [Clostridia bacterium]|nr:metal-dependent transcriptional regulator [Clostridia bacterium]